MNIDTLFFEILKWINGEGFPILPAILLGAYGFVSLMLESFKKRAPPVWTLTAGYAFAAVWLWWFGDSDGKLVAEYGYWAGHTVRAIISAGIALIVPYLAGLALGIIFFVIPVMVFDVVRRSELLAGHSRRY